MRTPSAELPGLPVAEDIAAAGRDADVVGLDEISRGADPAQMHAVAVVGRDDIARARHGAADHVARRIDDARRVRSRVPDDSIATPSEPLPAWK